jgi:hypothetical protein
MRRLITVVSVLAFAALASAQAASAAEPRVGPPLKLSVASKDDGSEVLVVAGRGCRPIGDAPTSVVVTVEELPGDVFTATPDSTGHWSVEVPIANPNDFSLTVNAECDDYYGTKIYPQAGLGVAGTSVIAKPPSRGDGPVMANTGSRTGGEVVIGLAALMLGSLLLWIGRPRRA